VHSVRDIVMAIVGAVTMTCVGCTDENNQRPMLSSRAPDVCECARAVAPEATGIMRIELERTFCDGPCPVYMVALSRDGNAVFVGGQFADRQGSFVGRIDSTTFEHLCCIVQCLGFFEMQPLYGSREIRGVPSAILRVWRGDEDNPVVVEDINGNGPAGDWALQICIDGIAATIDWK